MKIRLDPLPDDFAVPVKGNLVAGSRKGRDPIKDTSGIEKGSEAKIALTKLMTVEAGGKCYPASVDDAWAFILLFNDWRVGDPRIVYRAHQIVAPAIRRANAQFRARMAA